MPDFSHITPLIEHNKGRIMRARVYSDVDDQCRCGGKYTNRQPFTGKPELIMPTCNTCNSEPRFYIIDCTAMDVNGDKIRHRIRHTKDRVRLDSAYKVAYILDVIVSEMKAGEFDIRQYDSAKSKEAFIFKNFANEFLNYQTARWSRGDISPKTLENSKGLIKKHLIPFFRDYELSRINNAAILKFRSSSSFMDIERTMNLATQELKSILNHAVKYELLRVVPIFPQIPKANRRPDVITLELAERTIKEVEIEVYRDYFTVLKNVTLRPCELSALTWKDIDFEIGRLTINKHFSGRQLLTGRKSIKLGKKQGSITFDVGTETMAILKNRRSQSVVSLSSYVFLNSKGSYLKKESMNEMWGRARAKLGHKHALYELRHVASSQLYIKTGKDLIKTRDTGGWTNTQTLERYVQDTSDHEVLFN